MLAIATPLGKDFLLLQKLTGTERISKLYQFEVDLLHEEDDGERKSTIVDPKSLIGQGVTVLISQLDGTIREITGIVNQFSQGSRNARFTFYSATIVPHIWILTQKFQSRIFQNISVPDILRKVFDGFEITWQIQGLANRRNYCTQYRESDFDFASRLMEEEGIYYYFEHKDGHHRMVVTNTPQSPTDCPSKDKIQYFQNAAGDDDLLSTIKHWQTNYRLQTGTVTFGDHHFQLPTQRLEEKQTTVFTVADNQKLELYDFPGGYARKYDGIDRSGGEQASELNDVNDDKARTVKTVIESLDGRYKVIYGEGDCPSMTAGYRFEFTGHPNAEENAKYLITEVVHAGEQSPAYISGEHIAEPYKNTFECIGWGQGQIPFRPRRETAKPVVHGSQTAVVVGPGGEEIFTDKYGRVKVQFFWDRDGQLDDASSCWVRVSQSWAGNKWGAVFIPRIGMEVIVHFLEGDPDQPIITGCVYNPVAMPPYTLPDEKTKSTIKSDSSKGSGGFNEIRFEDKKGSEQLFFHAEKNQDVRVKNDALTFIGHDAHLIVQNDQYEAVKKDKHLKVSGDRNEQVDGSISIKAATDIDIKAGTKFAVDAGSEIHLKSGATLTIETGASLTLKVGGNFININSGGVFISGTMVMINSGGAAGSGSGSNPDPPKDAKEADKAEPGSKPQLPPPSAPPARPVFTSPAALVLINAAQNGTPFCEICSRS